jgi:hypothetical protein
MAGMWRLKLLGYNDAIEEDGLFVNLKASLESARSIATARPDLRLVLTVPADALKSDRDWCSATSLMAGPSFLSRYSDWVCQIANRVNPASEDAVENAGTKREMALRRSKRVRRTIEGNVLRDMHHAISMTAAR